MELARVPNTPTQPRYQASDIIKSLDIVSRDMDGLVYVSAFERDHNSFVDHLFVYNAEVQKRLAKELRDIVQDTLADACIATTGSDGRLEKGSVSASEIILYRDGEQNGRELVECLRSHTGGNPDVYDPMIEIKDVTSDSMYRCIIFPGTVYEVNLVSPQRVLDAGFLCGNEEVLLKAKKKLLQEMHGRSGKNMIGKIKAKTKEHFNVSGSGLQHYKGGTRKHYDLDAGVAFYDPDRFTCSFKQGPLRLVQYVIMRDIIREVRKKKDGEIILDLHPNTVHKLNSLEVSGLTRISNDELVELTDSYKYFLWLYHMSQISFKMDGQKETAFDGKQVRDRLKKLNEICEKQVLELPRFT